MRVSLALGWMPSALNTNRKCGSPLGLGGQLNGLDTKIFLCVLLEIITLNYLLVVTLHFDPAAGCATGFNEKF